MTASDGASPRAGGPRLVSKSAFIAASRHCRRSSDGFKRRHCGGLLDVGGITVSVCLAALLNRLAFCFSEFACSTMWHIALHGVHHFQRSGSRAAPCDSDCELHFCCNGFSQSRDHSAIQCRVFLNGSYLNGERIHVRVGTGRLTSDVHGSEPIIPTSPRLPASVYLRGHIRSHTCKWKCSCHPHRSRG